MTDDTKPRRIQRGRSKGWRKPENTVCVDRSSKWGNPFIVGRHGTRTECVDLFLKLCRGFICFSVDDECYKAQKAYPFKDIGELRGKNLACYCKDHVCHASILLEIANA